MWNPDENGKLTETSRVVDVGYLPIVRRVARELTSI